jgi:enterobactin synthetase component D / holo-[acyl-carrier protein] synthase
VSFEVLFRRELSAGLCIGVSLPERDDFTPPPLHPAEAAFVFASPAPRRASFIGGRVALHTAIAALGGSAADATPPILSTPRGAPAMPPGFVGSVSHKRELAVAIVARAEPTPRTTIGIDLETPRVRRVDIAARVLTDGERAALAGVDADARDAEVLFRFAAKEAIYKALDPWVQRLVSFQEVEIVTASDGGRGARLSLARDEGPFLVELHDVSADGLVLVVASVTPEKK